MKLHIYIVFGSQFCVKLAHFKHCRHTHTTYRNTHRNMPQSHLPKWCSLFSTRRMWIRWSNHKVYSITLDLRLFDPHCFLKMDHTKSLLSGMPESNLGGLRLCKRTSQGSHIDLSGNLWVFVIVSSGGKGQWVDRPKIYSKLMNKPVVERTSRRLQRKSVPSSWMYDLVNLCSSNVR